MFRSGSLCAALAALALVGCNGTTSTHATSATGASSATNGAGNTTSPVTSSATNGSGSNGATTSGPGATAGSATGTNSGNTTTTGATSSTNGTTTGDCVPDGQFSSDPSQCCSGVADASGYCGSTATNGNGSTNATTSAGSTGSGTTNGPNTSGTTSGTNGAIDFNGGWIPDDAGYQAAADGGGASLVDIGSGADASSSGKFGGAATGAAPQIVYPPNGILAPPNMNSLEFHFIPGAGQTLFKLEFHSPTATLDVYTGCTAVGSGCVYSTDATFWSQFVNTARGTAPVTYTLSGVNGASPGAVGTSAQQSIAFSDQDITGGIYFWNTSGEIDRYDWGLPGSAPETWMSGTPINCVGCHVLSREGDKAIVDRGIPGPQASNGYFDTGTAQPLTTNTGGSLSTSGKLFFSFAPGGDFALFSNGSNIGWRDLRSGDVLGTNITSGTMPDWAPSGNDMVFAKPQTNPFIGEPGVVSASIETMHFNGFGWDPASSLVPFSGENNYYPAYAPTGDWVAFNRSPSNNDSFANAPGSEGDGGAPDGELWAVASGGGTPIRLSAASDPGALSWPKWAPVVSNYYGGHVMWLTFSTDRAYGLRLPADQETQLWMTAFDPDVAAGGADPSFPAFYFPYQDIGGGNHIAQWVTTIVRQDCTQNSECPTKDTCVAGKCVPPQFSHGLPVVQPPRPKQRHPHR